MLRNLEKMIKFIIIKDNLTADLVKCDVVEENGRLRRLSSMHNALERKLAISASMLAENVVGNDSAVHEKYYNLYSERIG